MKSEHKVNQLSEGNAAVHRYYDIPCESPSGKNIAYFRFDGPIPGPGNVIVADSDGCNPEIVARVEGNCIGHVGAEIIWIDDNTIHFTPNGSQAPQSRLISLSDGSTKDLTGRIRQFHPEKKLAAMEGGDIENEVDKLKNMLRGRIDLFDINTGDIKPILTIEQGHRRSPLEE